MENASNSTPKLRSGDLHKWLVLLLAVFVMVTELGLMYSLGKVFAVIMSKFGSTRSETAVIQSTMLMVFTGAGIVNGALIRRFGPRRIGLFGACISSLGLVASFFATSTIYLTFSIGLCTAFGTSVLFISSSTAVGKHFVGKRSLLALSVLLTGSGVGGMIYPYVLTYLNDLYGLRGTLLIIGGIKLHGVAAALLWGSPAKRSKTNSTDTNNSSSGISVSENSAANKTTACIFKDIETTAKPSRTYIITYDLQREEIIHTASKIPTHQTKSHDIDIINILKDLLRNRYFVLHAIGISLLKPVLNLFIIFIVDIFSDSGLSDSDSSLGLLLMNIFGIFGRLLPGIILQKANVSALAVPIIASIIGTAALVAVLLLNSLEFYLTVWCVAGIATGLLVSSVSVTTITLVGKENLPNAIGAILTLVGVGNAAAGPVSGMIRDETGSYTLVFVLAAVVAAVALVLFAIAMRLQKLSKQTTKGAVSIFYLTKL